jgi:sulfate adenylyltransferase subunit 2
VVPLYFDRGEGRRYRSLGCHPCTAPIESTARTVAEIILELRSGPLARVPERAGRAQDLDDGGGLETLRRDGYM